MQGSTKSISSLIIGLVGIICLGLFIYDSFTTHGIQNTSQLNLSTETNSENNVRDQLLQNNEPFYVINVAAVKKESQARAKASELSKSGYTSGYLWIPNYSSLSGAQLYSVYIGPYPTQKDCEIATEDYRKKYPPAYGVLVSQEKMRVQINGVGKVKVTYK